MRIFGYLYDRGLEWAAHHQAPRYLALVSFAESSFFPVPVDVMLAPMVLANRERAFFFATLTTVMSVVGGLFGYLIGMFLFEEFGQPLISFYHAEESFIQIKEWFIDYGVWIVFIAGFTPIPFKIFTITSGLMLMPVLSFFLASLVGRSARFFLVAGLLYWGGAPLERVLRKWIDVLGWITVGLLAALYFIL
ncbi:MAG TPA: YqaA family protein [Arenicellales bacterium]|jgi:membrane protein YqaA with SNARE-associated domain|nr:YqaA family protein [Arenicellales bacterium]|tara:strand:+ start:2760 stop:3335 length:576 start_codon:yes stop_codon:yes gene_type:complete